MKSKYFLFIGIVIAVIAVLFFIRQRGQNSVLTKPKAQNNQTIWTNSNISKVSQETDNLTQTRTPSSTNHISAINDRAKVNEIRQYMESQNKPIEFYGKVTDQDGNPLAGVIIKGEVLHIKVIVPTAWGDKDEVVPIIKETDSTGRFEIQGITGRAIELESIRKNGYNVEPVKRAWKASEGTSENPVVFKMWSTNIHEPLVTGEKRFHIIPDGRPYFLNLQNGTIAESGNGDLKIWVKRPDSIIFGRRYDWSCGIEIVNGGLLQETNPYSPMFFAPSNGYEPTFQYKQEVGSGWSDSTGTKRFYITLKSGQEYGRIAIELYAYYNDHIPGLITIKYAVNPTGSGVLKL